MISDEDKEEAYQAAKLFYKEIENLFFVEDINFSNIDKDSIKDFYHPYRHQILSKRIKNLLEEDNGLVIKVEALDRVSSDKANNFLGIIREDPFLLTDNFVEDLSLFRTPLVLHNGISMTKHEGRHYAFLSISIKKEVISSIFKLDKIINNIEEAQKLVQDKFKDVHVINTGASINSNEVRFSSIKEINSITLISCFAIFILIFSNFKSIVPFLFGITSIAIGFIVALIITSLIFKEINLLTLIIGAGLIGVSTDFSFHFFVQFLNNNVNKHDGYKLFKNINPIAIVCLVTSIIGYMALFFIPLPIFQQISIFSITGLVTSYLVVMIFFPMFYKPKDHICDSYLLKFSNNSIKFFLKNISKEVFYVIIVVLLAICFAGFYRMQVNYDNKILNSVSQKLIDDELLVRQILWQDVSYKFIIVTGNTQQEVLQKEQEIGQYLEELIETKSIFSFQSLSQISPSIEQQEVNVALVRSKLMEKYLEGQSMSLGLSSKQIQDLKNNIKNPPSYITPDNVLSNNSLNIFSKMWPGKVVDNKYMSIMFLDGVSKNVNLEILNNSDKGIYFFDKKEYMHTIIGENMKMALFLLILTSLLMFVSLGFLYGFLRSLAMNLLPILSGSLSIAIISLMGYEINIFNIIALFLVIGIGIDYVIFYAQDKNVKLACLTVLLSSLTTMLSFGLLAFSHFAIISSFGLTVLFGAFFCYILSPMILPKKDYNW